MNYAGFWIRFLAYVADSLIVVIAFFAIKALLAVMGLELAGEGLILFALGLLYYAFMQASPRQATFGKALVGLKVGGLEGERISFGRALAREAAKILSFLTLFLGFVIAGFTQRKQALHDLMATTCVVRTEPGHVVAALAVALVALMAPFVVAFTFGAGMITGVLGGLASVVLTAPETTAQAPTPAAPPAPPAAKPQAVQVAAPAVPAKPEPAKAEPAKAVVIPVSAPMVLVQAPPPPPKLVPESPQEPAKPTAELPKEEEKPKPPPVREAPAPRVIPGPVTPGPRFNDLGTAVLFGDPKAVEELLAFGKWPDKPDSRGVTPLMLAATLGDARSAEALLKAGANPNRPGPGGDTAMSIARERKDAAMQGLLQRYGGR